MAQLIPANWKQALTDLREDIQRALERWLPKRHIKGQRSENLSARWREAMGQLQEEVSDALDRWLPKRRDTEGKDEGGWLPPSFTGAGPLIEVEETEDDVIVLAEMSGLDKDDFTVEVTADRLVLRGEKRREVEE